MDETIRRQIWDKARTIKDLDPKDFRLDPCGAIIAWHQYGSQTQYGWVIDHIYPRRKGGDDNPENLRVMQWENNISKGDDYPLYYRKVTSNGASNVDNRKQFIVNRDLRKTLAALYNIPDND